jgi:hypothetical protein
MSISGQDRPSLQASAPQTDLAKLQALANLMDSAFQVPGTPVRVGLDGILGLIPGAGDTVSALMSVYILYEARRLGISRLTLNRMATNVALDALVGTVPFAGDLFDVHWKANQKNVQLLRLHLEAPVSAQTMSTRFSDWLFFGGLMAVVIATVALSVTLAYFTMRWLWPR